MGSLLWQVYKGNVYHGSFHNFLLLLQDVREVLEMQGTNTKLEFHKKKVMFCRHRFRHRHREYVLGRGDPRPGRAGSERRPVLGEPGRQ